ncbi:hypothetical protein AWC38_SpisGene13310 [Stylophora pistillata]|uniref:Uncharacterized protein n=1 Tax=Stylophora pistillata TaxID=50429 RepID=A0A2B4S0U1_STYPI|nr:hypothetical protein AWC38_SpisGene13310 [Stylophora pistillata]
MAVSLPSSQEDGKYTINIINSKIETLVIGDGNVVNNYCRCLEYPEHSAGSRSGRKTTRRTATYHDGGERRRIKRKQTKLRFPQRKYIGDSKFPSKNISDESDEDSSYGHCGPEIFPSVSGERDCAFERSIKRFHIILNRLHPLRDSGKFEDFTSVADGMLMSSKGDLELELLILLEKSVIVSYQNDLENAESMVLEVLNAQTCLQAIQEKYDDEMSGGQKMLFLGAKSDLNYRLGDLETAQSEASQALSLAETFGFNLEIIPIREKLEDISKLITSTEMMSLEPSYEEGCVNSLSSSTVSCERNSPSSSGCKTE